MKLKLSTHFYYLKTIYLRGREVRKKNIKTSRRQNINCKNAIPVIRLVELYCSSVVPVVGIVFTYLQLIWELKKQQIQLNEIHTQGVVLKVDDNVKRVRVVVSRIVTVFLICYLPFLAERQYYLIMLSQGSYHEISAKVSFVFDSK